MAAARFLKLSGFCCALLLIRIFKTGEIGFAFLLWNLFLAWLPWHLIKKYDTTKSGAGRISILFLCILFLPNAPYILTDLFHLKKSNASPMWFDLIMILSFAVLGMVFFILSLRQLLRIIRQITGTDHIAQVAKIALLFSCGYGIYLGRYLRFNSWDLFSNPWCLISGVYQSFFDIHYYKETLSVTLTFSIFLYLIYEITSSFKHSDHELS